MRGPDLETNNRISYIVAWNIAKHVNGYIVQMKLPADLALKTTVYFVADSTRSQCFQCSF